MSKWSFKVSPIVTTALVNLVVIGLSLAGLEAYFRHRQARNVGTRASVPATLRDRYVGWRNNPEFSTHNVEINPQGFRRNRSVSLEKPPGTVRIFFMGGSAAFGSGSAYPAIYGHGDELASANLIDYYLEGQLKSAFPEVQWEVINAAAVGYCLHQELAMLHSVLLRYRPDYVILMDGQNDVKELIESHEQSDPYAMPVYRQRFNEVANPRTFSDFLRISQTLLHQRSALFRTIEDHSARMSRSRQIEKKSGQDSAFGPVAFPDLNAEEQAHFLRARQYSGAYEHTARQIQATLKIDGVTPLFLLQPVLILSHKPMTEGEERMRVLHRQVIGKMAVHTFEQLYPSLADQMRRSAAENGFLFEDLTSVFDGTKEYAFTDYCHLTAKANEIIASKIMSTMRGHFEKSAQAVRANRQGDSRVGSN